MARNDKRKGNTSTKTSKKARVSIVEVPAHPATSPVGSSSTVPSREVKRHTSTHNVAPNPAKQVFRPPEEIEAAPIDDAGTSILDDSFPVLEDETLKHDTATCLKPKASRQRPELRAGNKLRDWLPSRKDFLEELLCFGGAEEGQDDDQSLCSLCHIKKATYRCQDCFSRALKCDDCLFASHADHPLHRIEHWDGEAFCKTSLRILGLQVALGHPAGVSCLSPAPNTRRVVICDLNGIHEVDIHFCECLSPDWTLTPQWKQLIRVGWFPATTRAPATVFTFGLLKFFQELNFQGKTNLYDFWKTIKRITNNSGGRDVPNRYKQLSHAMRLWRHLVMLKRFGRTHDLEGAGGTKPGELVVECAACPHPDKNLPANWENAPPHLKWLYTLFLMMDANFCARCKDHGFDNIKLAPGWAYYVEEKAYLAHVLMRTDEKDLENTCSAEHNTIRQASFHRKGYIASGVGAILCARHALVRKNGAGDLQQGERQANMDYLFFSTLYFSLILIILISYDIVCQWAVHLFARMIKWFPEDMHLNQSKVTARFAIPKKHFRVHGGSPHSQYSFNYLPNVGRTYGERIETHWSHVNPLALSTREMSSGMRHEVMNDNWGAWNWQKTLEFGTFLLRSLEEAYEMKIKQGRIFTEYNATFSPDVMKVWEAMVDAWNWDHSQPDPYEEPSTAISMSTVKLELALRLNIGQPMVDWDLNLWVCQL